MFTDKQHDEYDHMFIGAEEEEVDNSRKKSLALTLRFRAPDRTLGEKELNQAFEEVIAGIRSETAYELRS